MDSDLEFQGQDDIQTGFGALDSERQSYGVGNIPLTKDDNWADQSFREMMKIMYLRDAKEYQGQIIKQNIDDLQSVGFKPVQLIKVEENQFVICKEGAQVLRQIQESISIIAITGPQRTGKSFLLNKLLEVGNQGFEVGNSVKPCTQGIWIWGTPLVEQDRAFVFLDVEGSNSTQKDLNYDAKIYALVILISSLFIFNSKGVIDEHAINSLSLACSISEYINTGDQKQIQTFQSVSPSFLWLLRDFHLLLEERNGRALTANEYMEKILSMNNVTSKNARKGEVYQKVRDQIKSIFRKRNCVTLRIPVEENKKLQKLNKLNLKDLRQEFQEDFEKVRQIVFEDSPMKRINGCDVQGQHIISLLEQYVDAINNGRVIDIPHTWQTVIENEYNNFLKRAKKKYEDKKHIFIQDFPYNEQELVIRLHQAREKAFNVFKRMKIRDDLLYEKAKEDFWIYFNDSLIEILDINEQSSLAFCKTLINKLYRPIFKGLGEQKYSNNLDLLTNDWNKAMETYEKEAIGPGKMPALLQFAKENQHMTYGKILQDCLDNQYDNLTSAIKQQIDYRKKVGVLEDEKLGTEQRLNLIRQRVIDLEDCLEIIDDEQNPTEDVMVNVLRKIRMELQIKKELKRKNEIIQRELNEIKLEMEDIKSKESKKKACCVIF